MKKVMKARRDLSVVHIGAGKYLPFDRSHVTYGIWRELASGFGHYHVIARSACEPAEWSDGNLAITLLRSRTDREGEFFLSQFKAVPVGVRAAPDVIVCQSPALGGLAAIAIARKTKAKILMELHGAEYFASARAGSRLWILQLATKYALKRADRIRVLSPNMQQLLRQTYGRELEPRTVVLPPRVDLAKFGPSSTSQVGAGPLRAAMVGAVNDNKGQLRLIEALRLVPFEIDLHLAGSGPNLEQCRKQSAALKKAGSNLRVTCEGPLPHDSIARLLHSGDLLIIYSRTEGTPRAAIEAMAAGLPVVTTNAGFCADVVEHGVTGVVLGPDPDSEIVQVLDRFHSDRSLLVTMGAAAIAHARRAYDSVELFEQYRKLIVGTADQ